MYVRVVVNQRRKVDERLYLKEVQDEFRIKIMLGSIIYCLYNEHDKVLIVNDTVMVISHISPFEHTL